MRKCQHRTQDFIGLFLLFIYLFIYFFLRWRPAGWKYNSVSEEWLQKGYSRLMRKTLIDPHNEIDEEGPKSY